MGAATRKGGESIFRGFLLLWMEESFNNGKREFWSDGVGVVKESSDAAVIVVMLGNSESDFSRKLMNILMSGES